MSVGSSARDAFAMLMHFGLQGATIGRVSGLVALNNDFFLFYNIRFLCGICIVVVGGLFKSGSFSVTTVDFLILFRLASKAFPPDIV